MSVPLHVLSLLEDVLHSLVMIARSGLVKAIAFKGS